MVYYKTTVFVKGLSFKNICMFLLNIGNLTDSVTIIFAVFDQSFVKLPYYQTNVYSKHKLSMTVIVQNCMSLVIVQLYVI